MCADLGGADGAFEDARDFGEREFLEAAQEEHLAIAVIEAAEGGAEEGVVVAGGGGLAGVGAVVGVMMEVGGIGGVGRGVGLAEVVGGAAAGEVIHPGGEAAVVAVGVAVFEHALEDDLGDVLGGGAVAGELDQEAEERAVVPFEEFAERVEPAIPDGEHQGMIGKRRVCGRVHGSDDVVGKGASGKRARIDGNFESGGEHGRS